MAVTRLMTTVETAGISSWNPTTVGNYYGNAWVETWNGTGYALCKFPNLSEIPSTATISQARLRWKMYNHADSQYERAGTSPLTIRANRITADWVEGSVTWNNKPAHTSTDAPSVADAFDQPGEWTEWWDVTTHVSDIVAGTYGNYGWLMEDLTYGGGVAFYNYGYIAELEVTYVAPAAATTDSPSGTADSPTEITDQVSGFDLTATFESEGNEPISSVTAQIFDVDGNQAWEYAEVYNHLTGNQQSVEADTTGFAIVSGAAIARVTTRAWHESASLQVTPAASIGSGARITFSTPEIGQEYSGRVMVSGPFDITLEMELQATQTDGTLLAAGSVQRKLLGNTMLTGCSQTEANSWTEFEVEDVTAVAATDEIRIEVTTTDTSAPVFYIDGNILNPDTEVAPWISQGEVTFPVPENVLEYGGIYAWRVKADNSAGSSGWSPRAYFKSVLSAVTGLSVSGETAEALIRLLWDAHPGQNLAGYKIYRAETGETLAKHNIDLVTTESYDDDAAETSVTYDYKVAAIAADGYEGPQSSLDSESVTFTGTWLGTLSIGIKDPPQFDHPRLQSKRVALDGSVVSQDYGFAPRDLLLNIQYLTKTERENILDLLETADQVLAYRDFLGDVMRGKLSGSVDQKLYRLRNQVGGVMGVRIKEVLPDD